MGEKTSLQAFSRNVQCNYELPKPRDQNVLATIEFASEKIDAFQPFGHVTTLDLTSLSRHGREERSSILQFLYNLIFFLMKCFPP